MSNTQDPIRDPKDGENRAVRAFLLGCELGIKNSDDMKHHMRLYGTPFWPEWVEKEPQIHMSKSAQQSWLRHLFGLEQSPAPAQASEPSAPVCAVCGVTNEKHATYPTYSDHPFTTVHAKAAPAQASEPSAEHIAKVALGWAGLFPCPICGRGRESLPHQHTPEEITIYRNGIKWGVRRGKEQWPWDGYPSPPKDASCDAEGLGTARRIDEDQHHEYRAGEASFDGKDAERDSGCAGIQGASDVQAQVTAPAPAVEPLTDEQIDEIPRPDFTYSLREVFRQYARSIERAHGITTTPAAKEQS